MQKSLAAWIAYSYLIRGEKLRRLMEHVHDGDAAWHMDEREVQALVGFRDETITKLREAKKKIDPATCLEKLEAHAIQAVSIFDDNYPPLLSEVYDAPAILYYQGTLPTATEFFLGVVGTRKVTTYGKTVTIQLVRQLAPTGLAIVSGLARGIDALAHETTLEGNGRTIAVIGSGLAPKDIYPKEHARLAKQIVERGGCMLSEYPPGVGPEQRFFPERNRIIAGLSHGTLVIEAPEKSGALITAYCALEYNREVLAVPGNIHETNSTGTNLLLKRGAHVVTNADDVLQALGLEAINSARTKPTNLSTNEEVLYNALSSSPLHIDTLLEVTSLPASALSAAITTLELKGLVRDLGGKNYIQK